jgi:hypothetical protein
LRQVEEKDNKEINFCYFIYLAAASGAVDEAIFEDAFNSSPAIPVTE